MLSIIIPVYNKYNITLTCLKDICRLPAETHEIIVVDDGSTDKTESVLANRDDIKYIHRLKNGGYGSAVNTGFRYAKGDMVLVLNNDIRVKSDHENWTSKIVDFLKGNDRYLVGPTGGYLDPKTFDFRYETNNPNKEINYMSGWCFAARRTTWDEVATDDSNIFDPDFKMYFEDASLSFKATQLGIKFKLINVPLVHFKKLSSNKSDIPRLYTESKAIFASKWGKNA